jgi:hypothetical protein
MSRNGPRWRRWVGSSKPPLWNVRKGIPCKRRTTNRCPGVSPPTSRPGPGAGAGGRLRLGDFGGFVASRRGWNWRNRDVSIVARVRQFRSGRFWLLARGETCLFRRRCRGITRWGELPIDGAVIGRPTHFDLFTPFRYSESILHAPQQVSQCQLLSQFPSRLPPSSAAMVSTSLLEANKPDTEPATQTRKASSSTRSRTRSTTSTSPSSRPRPTPTLTPSPSSTPARTRRPSASLSTRTRARGGSTCEDRLSPRDTVRMPLY